MSKMTKNNLRRMILKEMILRECSCQDQESTREMHGVKFHNNGPSEESGMIRSNLYTLSKQAQEMHDMIGMNDDLDEWVQEKIAVASSMIDSVYDYLSYEYMDMKGKSHDSELMVDDEDHHDRIASFETGYDFAIDDMEDDDDDVIYEVAPPGGEDVVKALKGKKGIRNPYAVAWSMKNKSYDLDEEDEDKFLDDELTHEPWKPLRQSTGIMFFEDEQG